MGSIKIAGKNLRLLLVFLSLAIFAYIYLVVYEGYVRDTEQIKEELESVQMQIAARKDQIKAQEGIKEKIKVLENDLDEVLQNYPSRLTLPDTLLFLHEFETENRLKVVNASLTVPASFYETVVPIKTEVTAKSEDEVSEQENPSYMTGYKGTLELSYQASYQDLKDCINYIEEFPQRITLDSISMAYDTTTGLVTGSMSISLYAIEGNGVPYTEPDLKEIEIGKDVLFETMNK